MRLSKSRIYLHYVWTTRDREPWLSGDIRRTAYRVTSSEVDKAGCDVLALGGVDDHIHLAVRLGVTISAADLIRRVKSATSHVIRSAHPEIEDFRWQAGYGVFSYGPGDRDRIRLYIERQEAHHAEGQLWHSLEDSNSGVPQSQAPFRMATSE